VKVNEVTGLRELCVIVTAVPVYVVLGTRFLNIFTNWRDRSFDEALILPRPTSATGLFVVYTTSSNSSATPRGAVNITAAVVEVTSTWGYMGSGSEETRVGNLKLWHLPRFLDVYQYSLNTCKLALRCTWSFKVQHDVWIRVAFSKVFHKAYVWKR